MSNKEVGLRFTGKQRKSVVVIILNVMLRSTAKLKKVGSRYHSEARVERTHSRSKSIQPGLAFPGSFYRVLYRTRVSEGANMFILIVSYAVYRII